MRLWIGPVCPLNSNFKCLGKLAVMARSILWNEGNYIFLSLQNQRFDQLLRDLIRNGISHSFSNLFYYHVPKSQKRNTLMYTRHQSTSSTHQMLKSTRSVRLELSEQIKTLICHSYPKIAAQLPHSIHSQLSFDDQSIDSWSIPLLAHTGTPFSSHEPSFIYANQSALDLFAYTQDQLLGIPSRLSAEPVEREARDRMMKEAAEKGFVSDYEGIRITSDGRRFRIWDALIWNLQDPQGRMVGQAACLPRWEFLSTEKE